MPLQRPALALVQLSTMQIPFRPVPCPNTPNPSHQALHPISPPTPTRLSHVLQQLGVRYKEVL